tara:strand:+ start:411 stop:557 length:147 start_codon:yes stop_codon:yes gene_type:complete
MGTAIEIYPFDVFQSRDRSSHPNMWAIPESVKPQKGQKKQQTLLVVVA